MEENEDTRGMGKVQFEGALAFWALGERDTAVAWLSRAFAIFQAIEHPKVERARAQLAEWTAKEPDA